MSDAISQIAAAMRADADALRAVSQNIANAESVAYRRAVPVAHARFEALAAEPGLDAPAQVSQMQRRMAVDLQAGTLRSTGEALNLALEGAGFFTVATASGEALTRRGDFRLDADGTLVTASGDPVLGEQGPIAIGSGTVEIDPDGTVRVAGERAGRLRIVEAADAAALQAVGDGTFTLPAGSNLIESGSSRVRQGFLETSNVSAVGEMIRMMEIVRHFEASQRLARVHDDMFTKAISQLGRV